MLFNVLLPQPADFNMPSPPSPPVAGVVLVVDDSALRVAAGDRCEARPLVVDKHVQLQTLLKNFVQGRVRRPV